VFLISYCLLVGGSIFIGYPHRKPTLGYMVLQKRKENVEKVSEHFFIAMSSKFWQQFGCTFHPGMVEGHMLLAVACDIINQSTCLARCHLLSTIHDPSQCHGLLSIHDFLRMHRQMEILFVFLKLICRCGRGKIACV